MRPIVLAALALVPYSVLAQISVSPDDGQPRVMTSATRIVRLLPDKASFYAIIEGPGETSADASDRAAKKVQAVTDAIKAQGARAEMVSSIPFGVAPAPNYGGYPGQPLQNPFVGRHVIRIQTNRVDQISAIAAGVGMRLGALIEVSSSPSSFGATFAQSTYIPFGRGFEMNQPAQPPDVTVNAGVTLRYRLVPR